MTTALVPRWEFPVTEHVAYLDAANDGLVPASVRASAADFWHRSSAGEPGYGELRAHAYEDARDAVAALVNVDRTRVAVTTSASEALAQIAWGLDLPPGANVVVLDVDFPTVTYPWLRLAQDRDLEIRVVSSGDDLSRLGADAIAAAVDRHTGVVSVSHVQFATGHLLDLDRLADVAHAHDALLAVDAAQSAGAVPIDLTRTPVDVLVGHAGKWLCAETGAGFGVVTDAICERLRPPLPGWRSTADPWDIDGRMLELAADARKLEISSSSYLSRFTLAASIRFLLGVGIERIRAHTRTLGEELACGLDELGAEIPTPRDDRRRAGIVAARFDNHEPASLVAELGRRDVYASARGGWLRLSVHLFNDSDDVQRTLAALADVVGR